MPGVDKASEIRFLYPPLSSVNPDVPNTSKSCAPTNFLEWAQPLLEMLVRHVLALFL